MRFISFGKLLALLLLISYSVAAKVSIATNEFQDTRKAIVDKAENFFHKNMLQPQVVHVGMTPEHSVKTVHSGYFGLLFSDGSPLVLKPFGQTQTILQDMDRCESVSRLLFPFHYFW
ncbi:MAG: hypothetical protein M0D53_06260 [Flavobacterium sp. JAD_PAG50586_2]|nr:MAG: hypothetical protein M0D53_06260 [Flavobacterium sp. JAD_PAG50586_2]